ncbi:SpoIIE family protein phosphatase [Flavobacteriales bacterium]|nr:SpoIIE family protein phosphatase [Flavobacteriales bacterium]
MRKNNNAVIDEKNNTLNLKQFENLYEIKGNRRPIGPSEQRKPFINHCIKLEKGDCIYFFTDGYPDQFGGPKGKKFMYKSFKRLLISIAKEPIEEQRILLDERFEEWRSDHEQVDDICVIGVKF